MVEQAPSPQVPGDTVSAESPDPPVVVSVKNVHHSYRVGGVEHDVLHDVSLEIRGGEVVSIVGPSGAGKSTLLRCIAGLLKPNSGKVEVLGASVSDVPANLSVVFQDYSRSLFPWMRVDANVEFPLKAAGLQRNERKARVREALTAVGLTADRKYPWQLSGGMQQRVAIARALSSRPRILLMDEPFASVDAQTRADLEDLTLAVRDRFDMTVVVVTHDIDESVYLSDRVVVLSHPPATVANVVRVELPAPRDQIATRSDPDFVALRTEVASYIRSGA